MRGMGALTLAAWQSRRDARRHLLASPDLSPDLAARLWHDPDAVVAAGTSLKSGGRCTVVRLTGDDAACVVKRYNRRPWAAMLAQSCAPSRARRNLTAIGWLQAAGIRTPQPRAVLDVGFGPVRTRSYLVIDAIEGEHFRDYVRPRDAADPALEPILRDLGETLRRLAAAGLSHGDGKAENYLVSGDRIWMIDLDGVARHRSAASLAIQQRADRARFLRDFHDRPDLLARLASAIPEL